MLHTTLNILYLSVGIESEKNVYSLGKVLLNVQRRPNKTTKVTKMQQTSILNVIDSVVYASHTPHTRLQEILNYILLKHKENVE